MMGTIGELEEIRVVSESGYSYWEWKIPHLYCLPTVQVNECFNSDSFQALGESWHLRIYPSGQSPFYPAQIVGHLVKENPSGECNVKYKMILKKSSDVLPNEFTGQSERYGASKCELFGFAYSLASFFECSDSRFPTIGCFLQRAMRYQQLQQPLVSRLCDIKLLPNPRTPKKSPNFVEASTQTESEICTEKLSDDLGELMLSGDGSDFTIQVKGVEFHLHRGILSARTPVFQSMLKHEMREKETGRVSVEDCEEDTFRAFVQYVYTGRTDQLHTDVVFGLFALADKYQVDELKSACVRFIRNTLSVDTFCDVVQHALTYDNSDLLQQAIVFLANKTSEVMKTVKWMNFLVANHIQANELLLKALDIKRH